jgi:hypothetical protein
MATTRPQPTAISRRSKRILADLAPAELPAPPASIWKVIGPGIVAAGVGLGSGEFVIFPYIASHVGLAFLWAAVLGVLVQYFLNTEIERYTLATGESVLTGFSRLWRHWGGVLLALGVLHSLWPGWANSSASLLSYLFGGSVRWITIGLLVAIGLLLTMSRVVYHTLERAQALKMIAIGVLIVGAILFAIPTHVWAAAPAGVAHPVLPVSVFGWAMLTGAIAYAGAGGPSNLCMSSWIRDKGFGMASHAPRIESPLLGEPVAAPGTGWRFAVNAESMKRWHAWWRFAKIEQLSTFVAMTLITIIFTSVLASALLHGRSDLPHDISFLGLEAQVLSQRVGDWFGNLFLIVGAFALFMTAVGVVDVTARLAADVLRTVYWSGGNESVIYSVIVWTIIIFGSAVVSTGASQPLVLLIISAVIAGFMMFVYSALLLVLNRSKLEKPLRPSTTRTGVLILAILLFGGVSAATLFEQLASR